MKGKSVLTVGCGQLGIGLGRVLQPLGWQAGGLARRPERLPDSFVAVAADYVDAPDMRVLETLAPDYLVSTFTPVSRSLEGYVAGFEHAAENVVAGLGGHRPKGLVMASSTRVFAEREGGWVDENSPLTDSDPMAAAIIAAEQRFADSGIATVRVRFGGIYGAPGGRLLQRVAGGEICAAQPARYSNRLHRDDCAGFLAHLLLQMEAGEALAPIYIGVDSDPAPQHEVEAWLAQRMGVASVRESAPVVPTPGHKRCSNAALLDSGYTLRYPDYRAGYGAVLDAG